MFPEHVGIKVLLKLQTLQKEFIGIQPPETIRPNLPIKDWHRKKQYNYYKGQVNKSGYNNGLGIKII